MKANNKVSNISVEKLSKPEKLARIIYAAIARMIKAKNARIRVKNGEFLLDVDRREHYITSNGNFDNWRR